MCAALSSTLLFGGEENRSESLSGCFLDSMEAIFFLFFFFKATVFTHMDKWLLELCISLYYSDGYDAPTL